MRWDRDDFLAWLLVYGSGALVGGFRWWDALWLLPTIVIAAMLSSEYRR